ncbi:MAG: hypothetical protein ABI862_12190 [Ilumatobacteraceae bacterium]
MNSFDRRRLVLASIFTVAALPALWIINRNDAGSAAPAIGAAGVPQVGANRAPSTSAYTPDPPIFLNGPASGADPAVVDIIISPGPSATEAAGKASFRRYPDPSKRPCTTPLAPWGSTLTVTNTDNGQTTTCVNSISTPLPAGVDIVLHTDVFTIISDLTDAPVPVRISW